MLLGFIQMNTADRWLHVVLAAAMMAAGWLIPAGAGARTT
jgi:hypothetical protein